MKIEDKRGKSPSIPIGDLGVGQAFVTSDIIYIKTDEYLHGLFTCINLSTGAMGYMAREIQVNPVNAKVVIE